MKMEKNQNELLIEEPTVPYDGHMRSFELICPLYHERLTYFVAEDVLPEDEVDNIENNEYYGLNVRYRDYKLIPKNGFPTGYPIEQVKFINGYSKILSIRGMHRILCADIGKDHIHFMFNPHLKWKMLDYDNSHGSILKYIIKEKTIPIKYRMYVNYKNIQYTYDVIHIDDVWNLDKEQGLLVYYFDNRTSNIQSIYLDKWNSDKIILTRYPK